MLLEDKGEAPQADEEAIEVGKTYRSNPGPPVCCNSVTVIFTPSPACALCMKMLSVYTNCEPQQSVVAPKHNDSNISLQACRYKASSCMFAAEEGWEVKHQVCWQTCKISRAYVHNGINGATQLQLLAEYAVHAVHA